MLRDEIAQNRKHMKDKNIWERLKYFCYYYWKPVVIILIVIYCIAVFIPHYIEYDKEPSVYVAMVNSNIMSGEDTDLVSDYALSRDIDTDSHPVRLDASIQMSENGTNNLDIAGSEKLTVFLEGGSVDVLIAPEWVVESCASQAYLSDIQVTLPADLYEQLADRLIYHTYEDDGRVPVAVYVGDIPKLTELYESGREPYLAIGKLTERKETAIDFLRYLLES